jgi:hypothetical protein
MPYLRLYSRGLVIEQKRAIAQKLIDITLRTFGLRAEERNRMTFQFITQSEMDRSDGVHGLIPSGADFVLEVLSHDLTERSQRAFGDEATSVLRHFAPVRPWARIARLVGIQTGAASQVVIQFRQLSPAISDPFVVDVERRAA